jgi:hypothetical protein
MWGTVQGGDTVHFFALKKFIKYRENAYIRGNDHTG